MDRLYCTVAELLGDLETEGVKPWAESRVMEKIKAASQWIDQNIGALIPVTATKRFDGDGSRDLDVPGLLAVTTIVDDETTLESSDFLLYPRNRWWENGPYSRIAIDPDASSLYNFSAEQDIVAVTGRWGLFERSISTGATVASQTDSATSLTVDNAAGVSAGAVLLIESEQEVVTASGAASDSTADLAANAAEDDDELTLTDGSQVNVGEVIKIGLEQMLVLDKATNAVLVTRGWNGSKRAAHTTGAGVYVVRTFTVTRGANGTTAAAHTSKAVSRYVAPEDVTWLCKSMAGLMLKKAQSGFAGKVGSVETGETYYFNEFPRETINRIKNHYTVAIP